jgi:hypothetical protein
VKKEKTLVTSAHVHVNTAIRTPQFWLLWGVLCLNVSAGIGVIGMASPMLQEVFGGQLVGIPATLAQLAENERAQVATIAAAFAGLLSLFNIAGRIAWASASDVLGRKLTYTIFFLLGFALYVSAPIAGEAGRIGFFVAIFCVILTMYGGGFATVPAYLADLFGTQHVGAIHGVQHHHVCARRHVTARTVVQSADASRRFEASHDGGTDHEGAHRLAGTPIELRIRHCVGCNLRYG